MDTYAIVQRVLDAVPARSYEMNALLSLSRIEVTGDVPTAAVTCQRRPRLLLNPDFLDQHCRSDEHLFLLVMHELHHVLLGHTRLFPRATPAHNLAFDAIINAMLVARFPQEAYTSFFTRLYGEDAPDVYRLLAPPYRKRIADARLRSVHETLYGTGDVTAEEIFSLIVRHLPSGSIDLGRLLGSHGADLDNWGTGGEASPEFIEAVRAIVEKWPPPEMPIRGRSLADVLKLSAVQPTSLQQRVLDAVRTALCAAASRPGRPRMAGESRRIVDTPLPELRDRKANVLRAAGRAPLLNAGELTMRRRAGGRAEVYLDVSGSVAGMLPALYGALRTLRAYVADRVHLFSTELATLDQHRICAGEMKTTGGTDIQCVLRHITDERPPKALIITDGYVGQAPRGLVDRASRACGDIRVLLTPGGWRRDLEAIASRIDELPDLPMT